MSDEGSAVGARRGLTQRHSGALSRRGGDDAGPREGEAKLLQAAEALLREGTSLAELSVARITERAGLTRTAFYFYFRDKRELLERLTEQVAAALYEQAEQWWSGEGTREELAEALDAILRLHREHAALLRAVVEASTYDEPTARFWRGLVERFVAGTERRLVADGVDPVQARALSVALVWGVERACYQQIVGSTGVSDADLVAALVEIWDGVMAPRRRPRAGDGASVTR